MKNGILFMACVLVSGYLLPVTAFSAVDIQTKEYTKEQVHGKSQDCSICHISHRMKGAGLVKKPISELCLDCHPDRKQPTEHVVDVIPSMDVNGLLLVNGKLTCVSCHDSHKNTFTSMLRNTPEALCQDCHDI